MVINLIKTERKNLIKMAITIIVTKLMKDGNYYVNEL